MIIKNDKGRQFYVRVVLQGDKYGLNDCLTHDKPMPMVEFYDLTYRSPRFTPRGQFVANYYADTLAEHSKARGLWLNGGVPEWSVDAMALGPVIELAISLCTHPDLQAAS